MQRRHGALATLATAALASVALAACGGADTPPAAQTSTSTARDARALAPPTATAGVLATIADVAAARARVGYVDRAQLRATDLPAAISAADVDARVLGRGTRWLRGLSPTAARTAIQLGDDATILEGPSIPHGDGRRRGTTAVVLGAGAALSARLAQTRPETSAITPVAQSAVQSCLGATVAQTILGPATMGNDAALGAGIATSSDRPSGLQLRICGAPHLLRHVHAMERALNARFGDATVAPERRARIGEQDIGEREIVAATIAADAVAPASLLRLLGGGAELRALAWR